MKDSNAGWYYRVSSAFFDEIFYWDLPDQAPDGYRITVVGPFSTFAEAKEDAIGYFITDMS